MASVHQNSQGFSKYWYACFRTAKGKRRMISTRETDREKAQMIADAWQAAERVAAKGESVEEKIRKILNETLERAGVRTVEVVRLKDWLTTWLAGKRQLAPSTRKGYEQAFEEFLKFMGPRSNVPIETVTEVDIGEFVDALLATGRSNSTVDKITKNYLSAPFAKAFRLGKIRFNPVSACERLADDGTTRDTFSPSDMARLIKAAPNADWKGVIIFGYCSGARLMDCVNLEWSGIDTEHGLVTFLERKKKQKSVVGLHPDFRDWLIEQPAADKDQKFVFPSLAGRRAPVMSRDFTDIMAVAGITGRITKERSGKGRELRSLSFHSLRHTATSATFNRAAAEDIARKVSGHSGDVIRGYIHKDAVNLRAAVQLIPRLPKE